MDGTTESAEIIDRFTMLVAGTRAEFATHITTDPQNKGLKKLSHFATGMCLTWVPASADVTQCRILAEEVFSRYSKAKILQRFSEPEQINTAASAVQTHQPPKEDDMSLEQAIEKNTAAVAELTAALLQHIANNPGKASTTPAVDTLKAEEKPKAEKTVKAPKEEKKVEPPKEETKPAELSLDTDIKPLAVKLAADKGRDALVALLQRLGVAGDAPKTSGLKPTQYGDFIELANKTLAGEYDPMASETAEDDV
jgi:predicted RNA-binding Zn ribbon-like protein